MNKKKLVFSEAYDVKGVKLLPEMKIMFEYDHCGTEMTNQPILKNKHRAPSGGKIGKLL